ncbi:MAG: relaxase/mobilization nuclease domain-containing protein, partial [Bryobacterales bacterium]|nr:relaxase/mobilization nuclease domain-containing protein [Bryobacterales bacterium]
MSDVGLLSKLIKGTGLRGAVNYASQNGELAPLCGNMAGTTPRALAAEFSAARVLRPSCKKACWHFILSLPDQADDLSQEDWDKAARTYLQEMGVDPDRHQWVAFKHSNTDHPHLHIIASRIAIRDGKLAREHRGDYRLSHKAAAAASRAVGLKPVAPAPAHQRRASLRRGEIAHAERVAGSPHRHPKLQIAARLDAALAHASSLEQFQSIAADHGVDVKFSSNSGGIYGVSYRLADPAEREGFRVEWVKGSQVGKAYTISSITRRLAGELDT